MTMFHPNILTSDWVRLAPFGVEATLGGFFLKCSFVNGGPTASRLTIRSMAITGKTIDSGVDVELRSKMRRFRKNKYYQTSTLLGRTPSPIQKLAHGTRHTSHGTRGRRVEIDPDRRAAGEPLQAVVMAWKGPAPEGLASRSRAIDAEAVNAYVPRIADNT